MRPDKECLGRLYFSGRLLNNALDENKECSRTKDSREMFRLVMEKIIVLKAEFNYGLDRLEYVCYCEEFKPISLTMEVPLYRVLCHNDYGKITIEFEEAK